MRFFLSKKHQFILGIALPLIVLDQLTKIWAISAFKNQEAIIYFADFFRFEYAENTGAFLSLGSQLSPMNRILILNVAVSLFLVYVAYVLLKKKLLFGHLLAFTLLLAGGVGNLIDRIFRGVVIDFMNMGIGSLRTGIFNVADMAIMAGLVLMILPEKLLEKKTPNHLKNM